MTAVIWSFRLFMLVKHLSYLFPYWYYPSSSSMVELMPYDLNSASLLVNKLHLHIHHVFLNHGLWEDSGGQTQTGSWNAGSFKSITRPDLCPPCRSELVTDLKWPYKLSTRHSCVPSLALLHLRSYPSCFRFTHSPHPPPQSTTPISKSKFSKMYTYHL